MAVAIGFLLFVIIKLILTFGDCYPKISQVNFRHFRTRTEPETVMILGVLEKTKKPVPIETTSPDKSEAKTERLRLTDTMQQSVI